MCIMLAPTSAFPELGRRKGHLQQCRTNEIVYDLVERGLIIRNIVYNIPANAGQSPRLSDILGLAANLHFWTYYGLTCLQNCT